MKKNYILTILLLTYQIALGGSYYDYSDIDQYSVDGGVYYLGVESEKSGSFLSKSSGGRVVNIQVFDLINNQTSKVFEKNFEKDSYITELIIERPKNEPRGNYYSYRESPFRNLTGNRALKDKILIVVRNSQTKEKILWKASRTGKEPRKVVTILSGQTWHIDFSNQKIRVFTQNEELVKMDEYQW